MEEKEKQKILPELRKMALYKTISFPLVRYYVVSATIQRVQTVTPMRFTQKKNNETQTIDITRIK